MRVERWELRDFGSHRHTVLEPGDARLVIIQGENGVGKTTLASEALGHALFKDDRGAVNDVVRNGATDSSVSIEATFAGSTYRWIRRRSTKGAGKSSADLQVRGPDGRWTPVASGDREVPAATAELLRMDAATFRTSVSLAQKDLDRFVAAGPADRKAVLASIVVDPRLRPAAELASRRARDAEAAIAADGQRIQRLGDAIAELEPIRAIVERQREDLVRALDAIAIAETARTTATDRIRELDAQLAAADAVAGEVARLTAERDAALADWQRVTERRGVAQAARILAENTLAAAGDVEAATAGLPAVRAEVDRLIAGEAEDRRLAGEITAAQRELDAVDRPFAEQLTTWRTKREAVVQRIRRLEEQAQAGAATCEACGQPIGQAQVFEQLARIRADRDALGDEPKAPLAIARASAAVARAESRRRELAWDPQALVDARERLTALERTAARGEAIEQARATIAREDAAIAEAGEELDRIQTRGEGLKARLDELAAQALAAAAQREERELQGHALRAAETALQAAQDDRRDADGRIARSEASLARLDALTAERAALEATVAAAQLHAGRLRKLTAAFGLKGIPARIIEGVLPELEAHANDLLGRLFAMSLEVRPGRDKADGSGVIDEIDLVVRHATKGEIAQARLSGGEGTAVSLALAIGLSRLNARRAGTAIRTLVADEPDGLDEAHLRALGRALRELAHEGELERVVLITHTTTLAEYGDLVVELRDGPDGIETYIDGIRSDPAPAAALAA